MTEEMRTLFYLMPRNYFKHFFKCNNGFADFFKQKSSCIRDTKKRLGRRVIGEIRRKNFDNCWLDHRYICVYYTFICLKLFLKETKNES